MSPASEGSKVECLNRPDLFSKNILCSKLALGSITLLSISLGGVSEICILSKHVNIGGLSGAGSG